MYRRELKEMGDMIYLAGYWRDDAETLQEEGMGPEELRHILQTTTPGGVGSLEYTHRIKRRPDAGTRVGTRVQLHPGTDRWMMGDRYGEIVKDTGAKVMVHLDKSGKKIWFKATDVTEV